MKKQLNEAQKLASEAERLLAESRNLVACYTRSQAESGYESLTDMVLEASKTGDSWDWDWIFRRHFGSDSPGAGAAPKGKLYGLSV